MLNEQIKEEYLSKYHDFANETANVVLKSGEKDKKKQTSKINTAIKRFTEKLIQEILAKDLTDSEKLNETLFAHYASYIVMLEYRNKFWVYNSMDFARRVGELWEPFCKLPFQFPVNELKLVKPVKFEDVKRKQAEEYVDIVNSLSITDEEKKVLFSAYNNMATMLDSGAINLSLDLHFVQDNVLYNVDYKSGFNSNEKGNTNRLLLVGSIYEENFKNVQNIILVRQKDNNHYLETLKNSPYWDVYIENEAYTKINEFTGFDFRSWIDKNITWIEDLSDSFVKHLQDNDLIKYLNW